MNFRQLQVQFFSSYAMYATFRVGQVAGLQSWAVGHCNVLVMCGRPPELGMCSIRWSGQEPKWKKIYPGLNTTKQKNIDFREKKLRAVKKSPDKINLYEGIAASDFINLFNGSTSWDFVGLCGNYRTFSNIYRVSLGTFEFFPIDRPFPLPLLQVFPSDREMDRNKYMKDVLRWKDQA